MVRRLAVVAIALLFAVAAFAQPSSSALSRGLADALYAKLAGGSTVAGTTTFANLTVSGTCTGCGGGTVAWGAITGTLSAQTDLQSALDLKAPLNSPSFTTPSLGVATATTINKVTITTPAAGSTLTIANNKVFTVSNTMTLAGTDSTTMTFPSTSATVARSDAAETLTGTRTFAPTNSTNAIVLTAAAAGTGTVTTNGTLLTGSGTSFLAQVGVGDSFTPGAQTAKTVVYVSDNTHLRLSTSADTNASGLAYTITPTTHAIGPSGYDSQITTSRLVTLGGTLAAPAIAIGSSGATPDTALNRGFDTDPGGNGGIVTIDAGVAQFWVTGGQMRATSGGCHGWSSNSGTAVAGYDTTLCRSAAGTVSVGTAANNRLGFDVAGGDCFVASNQTNATATMQTSNCLVGGSAAITVTSGRKYTGVCEFFLSDSVAVDGAQIDFNGGTATATDFRAQITAFDTALNLSTQTTSLAGAGSASTFTGAGAFEVHFTFEPSANGTFLPRFAQVGHTTGTLTLARGSNCRVREM